MCIQSDFSAANEDKLKWSKRLTTQNAAKRSEENCANDDKDDDRCRVECRMREAAAAAATADFSPSVTVAVSYHVV